MLSGYYYAVCLETVLTKWLPPYRELEDTNQYMQDVKQDREALSSTISQQQENLQVQAR